METDDEADKKEFHSALNISGNVREIMTPVERDIVG